MKKRFASTLLISLASIILMPAAAFAHVGVTPSQVGIGEHLVFTVSVPNEKDIDVTSLKLSIPDGVTGVMPTTKEGWSIDVNPQSIIWSEGKIPAGQRQDFTFSAQVPAKTTELHWKAYQTYADGTKVNWDQAGESEKEGSGPYSVTSVVDDLNKDSQKTPDTSLPILLSSLALFISLVGIFFFRRRA